MKTNDKTTSIDKQQSATLDIAGFIKQKIINGELSPGDRIVETRIAREFGISQTPIREAIRRLAGENVVTIIPNKGPLVNTLNARDVFEIYSYRSVLEGMACRLAVQNVSLNEIKHLEQFFNRMKEKLHDDTVVSLTEDSDYIHSYIFKLSKHSILLSMFEYISFRVQLVNRISGMKTNKEREVSEHAELVEVLKLGNPDEAERVMREHIHRSYKTFLDIGMVDRTELARNEWI